MNRDGPPPSPRRGPLEPLAEFGETAPVAGSSGPVLPFRGEAALRRPATAPWPSASSSPEARSALLVQLLWVDPAIGSRIRRPPDWRAIIDAIENESDPDLDDDASQGDAAAAEARRNA